jgi:polyisoprenoid-binding protein YceI
MTSPTRNPPELASFVGTWTLDPDRTSIAFRTKALWMFPVKGTAKATEGSGTVNGDGSLSGTLVVDAASISTGLKKRDAHLQTNDFFDVATFPTLTFEATGGRPTGAGTFELTGTLTVHGESRPVTLSVDVGTTGTDVVTLATEVEIDRSEWGLTLTPFGAGLKNRVVVSATYRKS